MRSLCEYENYQLLQFEFNHKLSGTDLEVGRRRQKKQGKLNDMVFLI